MLIYLDIGLCIINIALLIVFIVVFKKRFSTKNVIDKTRAEMDQLIKELQKNTVYHIDLMNSSCDRLKALNAETEKKIEQMNKKLQLIYSESQSIEGARQIHENARQATKKKSSDTYSPEVNGVKSYVNPEAVFKVNVPKQKDLFDQALEVKDEVVLTQDGAAYREVPLIATKIVDEKPSVPVRKSRAKKSEQVMELFNSGYSIKEITQKLNLSEIEVQLILDMNN